MYFIWDIKLFVHRNICIENLKHILFAFINIGVIVFVGVILKKIKTFEENKNLYS